MTERSVRKLFFQSQIIFCHQHRKETLPPLTLFLWTDPGSVQTKQNKTHRKYGAANWRRKKRHVSTYWGDECLRVMQKKHFEITCGSYSLDGLYSKHFHNPPPKKTPIQMLAHPRTYNVNHWQASMSDRAPSGQSGQYLQVGQAAGVRQPSIWS